MSVGEGDALFGEAERWPLHDELERSCRWKGVQPEFVGVPIRRRAPTAPATVPHQHGSGAFTSAAERVAVGDVLPVSKDRSVPESRSAVLVRGVEVVLVNQLLERSHAQITAAELPTDLEHDPVGEDPSRFDDDHRVRTRSPPQSVPEHTRQLILRWPVPWIPRRLVHGGSIERVRFVGEEHHPLTAPRRTGNNQ